MEIYKKISDAIDIIKKSDLKKAGYNDYSKYAYYTPEQVNKLVYDACKEVKLFIKFDLFRNEFGMFGQLSVISLDNPNEYVNYNMSTDIPQITATNITQQLGGSMTYTKRYMLMNIFDIVDNTLDFDTPQKPQKKETKKHKLSAPQFVKTLNSKDAAQVRNVIKQFELTTAQANKLNNLIKQITQK